MAAGDGIRRRAGELSEFRPAAVGAEEEEEEGGGRRSAVMVSGVGSFKASNSSSASCC